MRCFKITSVSYRGISISRTLIFSILPITWTKSRFPSSVERCNFTSYFSNYPIFKSNFRFPWRFQKSEFRCVFGMILVSLDVRIVNVFFYCDMSACVLLTLSGIVHFFFRAIRSPPPQVRRCPYAYVSKKDYFQVDWPAFMNDEKG